MSDSTSPEFVHLKFEGNLGYSADQVDRGERGLTIGDLISALEEAAEEFGEDTPVVLYQVNNPYGANFGRLYALDLVGGEDASDESYNF